MRMRVDKPGQHKLIAAVDLPGICMFGGQIVIARGDDTPLVIEDQNTELLDFATGGGGITGYRMQYGVGDGRTQYGVGDGRTQYGVGDGRCTQCDTN